MTEIASRPRRVVAGQAHDVPAATAQAPGVASRAGQANTPVPAGTGLVVTVKAFQGIDWRVLTVLVTAAVVQWTAWTVLGEAALFAAGGCFLAGVYLTTWVGARRAQQACAAARAGVEVGVAVHVAAAAEVECLPPARARMYLVRGGQRAIGSGSL